MADRKVQFVKCDVRSWEDQVRLFDAAVLNSPNKSCDIVVANAGILNPDMLNDDPGKMLDFPLGVEPAPSLAPSILFCPKRCQGCWI